MLVAVDVHSDGNIRIRYRWTNQESTVMFGNTLTLVNDGVDLMTLSRIGDAGDNGSRYYKRDSALETSCTIRHSTYQDKSNTNRKGIVVDRHNVEIILRVFGNATTPDYIRKAYFVIENDRGDALNGAQDIASCLVSFLSDANTMKLLNWES